MDKCEVPFYLALELHKINRCQIELPDYLNIDFLQTLYEEEKENVVELSPLPNHFFEHTKIFLTNKLITKKVNEISSLIDQIEKMRYIKICRKLKTLNNQLVFTEVFVFKVQKYHSNGGY